MGEAIAPSTASEYGGGASGYGEEVATFSSRLAAIEEFCSRSFFFASVRSPLQSRRTFSATSLGAPVSFVSVVSVFSKSLPPDLKSFLHIILRCKRRPQKKQLPKERALGTK